MKYKGEWRDDNGKGEFTLGDAPWGGSEKGKAYYVALSATGLTDKVFGE